MLNNHLRYIWQLLGRCRISQTIASTAHAFYYPAVATKPTNDRTRTQWSFPATYVCLGNTFMGTILVVHTFVKAFQTTSRSADWRSINIVQGVAATKLQVRPIP